MKKLSLTDKKILLELDTNARQSGSEIARKLGMSPEAVNYKIREFEKRGLIREYLTLTDFSKIGLLQYKFYFKFSHLNDKIRKEVVQFLFKYPQTKWIADCEGAYDMMLSVRCFSLFEFERLKYEIFERIDKYLSQKRVAVVSEAETFPRRYILPSYKVSKVFPLVTSDKEFDLEKEDDLILSVIATNARISVPEISKKTELTPRVIRYRIRQLEKKGFITGYKLAFDYRKIGYLFFKCFFTLQNANPQRIRSFRQYCRQHPNITYWVGVFGEWEMEHEFECESLEEFYDILDDIREKFSDIIKTIETAMITKEHVLKLF